MRDFLTKHATNTISHALYLPDMAPCDFFLFSRLKLSLRGKCFDSLDAIKQNSTKELKSISSSAYEKCDKDWVKCWQLCIASNSAYFEGDKINLA